MVKILGGMNMKQKYFRVKGVYKDYIVFVRSGNFWNCFYADALIIHVITGYNFKNYRVGFPFKVLGKVIDKVRNLNINFVLVYELDDIVKYEYPSNSYTFYLNEYMSLYKKSLKQISTLDRIVFDWSIEYEE